MRYLKVKIICGSLLPLFFFCLILSAGASLGAEQKPPTVKESRQAASTKKPRIPATTRKTEQIFIPGGKVTLGSDKEEKAYAYKIGGKWARQWRWFDGEKKRQVFVGDFSIDKYPVTQARYYEFIKDTGHRAPFISAKDYETQGFLVHSYKEVAPYLWTKKPPADKLNDPVVLVSVKDARAYCRWRGRGYPRRTFGLPSEDQWEKAARGSDGRYFPWGNSWDPSRVNIGSTGPGSTTPVNRYASGVSPYGVYEMAGNIFEWTDTPSEDDSKRNILKSCSWDDMPGFCRGAARHSRLKNSRHILIGFRCISLKK